MEINKIYNNECVKGMKNIEDKTIDLTFTSPPYNRIRNDTYDHYNDNNVNYYDLLIDSTNEMLRVTKGYVIINIQQNSFNKTEFFKFLGHYAEKINGVIVWEKTNPRPSVNYNEVKKNYSITNAIEYFIFIKDGGAFRANDKIKNIIKSSVNSKSFKGHGAVMKREVCDFFIKNFSVEGDLIMDPFMGMGTTAVCAKRNKRNYIGFELSKEYHKTSEERILSEFAQLSFLND